MIISQTPLRVSFFGGGTDFAGYYLQEGGCVLSTAIDKYIFVTVKERYDERIRVGYTRTELVDSVDEVEHELVRESLRLTGVTGRVEVNTMADIPSEGSGLGSSSTLTVGLLNALYALRNDPQPLERLAREACTIEIEVLGRPIGVQDQYIAAHGGLCFMEFRRDGSVCVERLRVGNEIVQRLNRNLLLFYTKSTRQSAAILTEQVGNIGQRRAELGEIKQMAVAGRALLEQGDLDAFGRLLDEGWRLKQRLASKVGNPAISAMYEAACAAGAMGGKITGAGGGGFLLLYCLPERQDEVRAALRGSFGLPEYSFRFERDGSKVIFNYRH